MATGPDLGSYAARYELAAVAAEGGFEPTELVVPEESTEPPDQPG